MLTGIRDLDREIVNKLSDKDLLQICLLNKTYSERVCDDSYFRLRTENGFPETVQYKENRSWKNHYLNIVKYIDLLQRKYNYNYVEKDKSPELLYLARRIVPGFYNKNRALIYASINAHLLVVQYLVENGADITVEDNGALIYASENGHLPVVKYLVEHGANITAQNNYALRWASKNGHLSVVKYLTEHGADIHAKNNDALIIATQYGHSAVAAYLTSLE